MKEKKNLLSSTNWLVVFIILISFAKSVSAQDYPKEFDKISYEELRLESYTPDPDAEALVLFDKGLSDFIEDDNGGFKIVLTRTVRIKIFKNSGFKFANVSIPYYQDGYGKSEIVKNIKANSYNHVNGSIQKKTLEKEDIFFEKSDQTWRQVKFSIPDVTEGSVIEYSYVLETPFKFNLPDWRFQRRIPTLHSRYVVKMIPFYEYVFLMQGASKV